jgi:hypothetical protein
VAFYIIGVSVLRGQTGHGQGPFPGVAKRNMAVSFFYMTLGRQILGLEIIHARGCNCFGRHKGGDLKASAGIFS